MACGRREEHSGGSQWFLYGDRSLISPKAALRSDWNPSCALVVKDDVSFAWQNDLNIPHNQGNNNLVLAEEHLLVAKVSV